MTLELDQYIDQIRLREADKAAATELCKDAWGLAADAGVDTAALKEVMKLVRRKDPIAATEQAIRRQAEKLRNMQTYAGLCGVEVQLDLFVEVTEKDTGEVVLEGGEISLEGGDMEAVGG